MMSPCNRPLHHTEFTSRTERGCPGRLLPSRTVLCFRHQLAWDWALVIVRGATFHHLVCDQLGHMMMSPCNQSLHHTEFTSRTERGCPGRPLPSRTVLWFRHQLAWDWALIIMRGGTFHHLVCDQKAEGTSDDATMQSVTASHGIHVTNRTRISRPTPPISNDVVTSGTGAGLVGPPQDPHLAKAMAASGHHTGRGLASEPPPPPITNGVVSRSEATSDTGAGLVDKNNVVDPNQDPGPLTGPGNEEHTTGIGMTQPWLRPPRLADHMWLRPPGFSRPPYNHHTGDFGMNCTHGAHTMVCKTTLRSHVCSSTGGRSHCLSCALDAHMFVLRRTSKHNQPPHMGLSSAAPCQAAWPFSVTLRLSSVHQKATSWARRRCAQETTPPPSASYTHERTSNPLFRRFLETPSRPVLSTAVTAPTGIRPRHKIFGQSTISPTTQKPHQTKTETGYGARPTVQHTRI